MAYANGILTKLPLQGMQSGRDGQRQRRCRLLRTDSDAILPQNVKALVDVITELWRKESLPELFPEGGLGERLELEIKYGQCDHCKTVTETVWCAGDPCPRCGGVVEATGEERILWD